MHPGRKQRTRSGGAKPSYKGRQQTGSSKGKCSRCGKELHPCGSCPANDAICSKCGKRNHFAAVCRTKATSTAGELTDSPLDVAFLDQLTPQSSEKCWLTPIQLCGKSTTFKIDTGAEVTAVNEETYKRLGTPALNTPDRRLFGPSTQPLEALGSFKGKVTHKGLSSEQVIYVIKGLKTNLLGLPAITALQLVSRLHTMQTKDVIRQFPTIFKGLGNLGEEFEIKLKPDAQPFALTTPRNIALPLRPKVEQELARMEEMGVISKVDEPTPWCAGMVVVPKKSGKVRICVDLKPLNESVLREVHPLPKVDETLAQLSGAKVFSKLDANSGFWQIPLSKQSRLLTTFITPVGRFCFNKLPFGISSAPEHFQKRMSAILSGLPGVVCQMDDVLVFGADQAEQDTRLSAALNRIKASGATLNPEKCEFSKSSVKFLGHIVDGNGIAADPDKTKALEQMKSPTNVSELR